METINTIQFDTHTCYPPYEQLLMVLPPRSKTLLPKSYQSLFDSVTSELLPYYPETFQLDTDYHQWFHECIPHLPIIPRTLVENVVKPLYHKLTSEEQIRNTFEEDFCITT